ncbi:hypothetical protein ACF1HU_01000 [Streptomyces olivaceus]|uniref:hypothetical protein n=1 Tax=Streptomyces olivaceus TaxID=47716 RepID=UPI0036F4C41D
MLHAKRTHLPSQEYEFTEDGRTLTTFSLRRGGTGARFTPHGAGCRVRAHRVSGGYELLGADGNAAATTSRVRRSWNMTRSGRVIPFRRTAAAV